jgi:predicted DNA-binding ribbon-helix-helix protein
MQSGVIKRSIVLSGHKTSVSLEDAFWNSLKEIGKDQNTTLSTLISGIDSQRPHNNLSSAIRLFVLDHYRAQLPDTAGDRTADRANGGMPALQMTASRAGGERPHR